MISWHVFATVEETLCPVIVGEGVNFAFIEGEHGGMVEIEEGALCSLNLHSLFT